MMMMMMMIMRRRRRRRRMLTMISVQDTVPGTSGDTAVWLYRTPPW